jgi:hypothetical protein
VTDDPVLMLDVNGDSFVTPLDVLLTIAYINASLDGEGQSESAAQDDPYPDVNGDGAVTPLDGHCRTHAPGLGDRGCARVKSPA